MYILYNHEVKINEMENYCGFRLWLPLFGQSGTRYRFVSVPLTIKVGDTIYTDDAQLNIDQMMEEMYATATASKSACPSPDDYMKSFEGADNIVVVTITGTLSGSYNGAEVAKKIYLEEHPTTNIHVINSLSAGGEVDLIVRKAQPVGRWRPWLWSSGRSHYKYLEKPSCSLFLAKVDNLVKMDVSVNWSERLSGSSISVWLGKLVRRVPLSCFKKHGAKESDQGCFDEFLKAGYMGGHITIAHRNNENLSSNSSELVREKNLPMQWLKSFLLLDFVVSTPKKAGSSWGMKFKLALKEAGTKS